MHFILVKTENRKSWSVNMSGPFETRDGAVEAVKQLHKKLNITHKQFDHQKKPVVYQFSVQYIDPAEADKNIVTF